MLLRFRSQIKKIKLSSYWSFGFLLIELRYEMASWTTVAPASSPGISGRFEALSTFFPPPSSEPHCPLCFCLLLTFPCFALGHVVFPSELCFPGGGLGFLCPWSSLGLSSDRVRLGQDGRASCSNLALLNLTEPQLFPN